MQNSADLKRGRIAGLAAALEEAASYSASFVSAFEDSIAHAHVAGYNQAVEAICAGIIKQLEKESSRGIA